MSFSAEERLSIINNKCPNCGSELRYCNGVGNYHDFLGCDNRDQCKFKGCPADLVIFILRAYYKGLNKKYLDAINKNT